MNDISIDIRNKQVLDNLVAGLSDFDKDRAIKSGLAKGGEVLKKGGMRRLSARMRKPTGETGNLLGSFYVRVKKNKPGVLVGFKRGIKGGNHAHLVNDGTTLRFQKSKNKRLGYRGGSSGDARGNFFWTDTKNQDIGYAYKEVEYGIIRFVNNVKARI